MSRAIILHAIATSASCISVRTLVNHRRQNVPSPGVITEICDVNPSWNIVGGGKIAWISVANEKRLNCLSTGIVSDMRAAVDGLADNDEIRAIVLTGLGDRSFIGGADLKELGSLDHDGARLYITNLHKACLAIRTSPHPVIGRVNGFCLGAGFEVAASCDMRVASDNAVFGMPEVHMGLPSVIEAALLPGLIGWGRTREILMTGDTFGADEAQAMQFVQKVVPAAELDAAVDAWLEPICRAAPLAVRSQKALMNRWERTSVEEGVYAGIDAIAEAYDTGEPQDRIAAFFAAKKRS
jgi:enoyl-CoA hydratase/carnithine racemase